MDAMAQDTTHNITAGNSPTLTEIEETSASPCICYDVRYEGEFVLVYDAGGRTEQSFPACLYKGAPEVVKRSGGYHIQALNESESIVINPKVLTQLTSIMDYSWYVKDRVLKDNGYQIHTAWRPIFLLDDCTSLPARSANEVYVIPAMKSQIYLSRRGTLPIIPLLETITHLHPMYNGMTLCQIACHINDGFNPAFNNPMALLDYLFSCHKDEFAELCMVENTPLHKLHQSTFNLTFGHNIARTIPLNSIRTVKQLENVFLVPLSRFFDRRTYGDVPWLIWNHHEKKEIEKRAKSIIYPLGFFENKGQVSEMKEAVFFHHVCILPEIAVEGHVYPAGGIMGVMEYPGGTQDTVLRGELFEGVTLREQMILMLMFASFIRRTLTPAEDCSDVLKNMSFHEDQITVRRPFIKAIQAALFRTR